MHTDVHIYITVYIPMGTDTHHSGYTYGYRYTSQCIYLWVQIHITVDIPMGTDTHHSVFTYEYSRILFPPRLCIQRSAKWRQQMTVAHILRPYLSRQLGDTSPSCKIDQLQCCWRHSARESSYIVPSSPSAWDGRNIFIIAAHNNSEHRLNIHAYKQTLLYVLVGWFFTHCSYILFHCWMTTYWHVIITCQ